MRLHFEYAVVHTSDEPTATATKVWSLTERVVNECRFIWNADSQVIIKNDLNGRQDKIGDAFEEGM